MRCNCCDKALSDTEIVWNNELKAYELCSVCLEIAMEAAFSQGYHRPDDNEIAVEIGDEFGDGIVETLDPDVDSWGDTPPYGLGAEDYDD